MNSSTARFWVHADHAYGLGHVVRARWLAEALRQRYRLEPRFRVNPYPPALAYLHTAGLVVESDETQSPAGLPPRIELVDALDPPLELMRRARRSQAPLVCFENRLPTAGLADVVVNAIVAGLDDRSWVEHGVPHHGGPGYLFLAPAITARRPACPRRAPEVRRILVSCGGTDPANQTARALALIGLSGFRGRVEVVVGAGYGQSAIPVGVGEAEVLVTTAPASLAESLSKADLAILSGGMTLYEAATLGLPALVVAQNDHQEVTARRFQEKGCAIFLQGSTFEEDLSRLRGCLQDAGLRGRMSEAGMALLDGQAGRLFPMLDSILSAGRRFWTRE